VDEAALAQIPLFAALRPEELTAIANVATEARAEAGDKLATESDFGDALYAIKSGTAEVSRAGEVVGTLGPGDVFGEVAVLQAGRRTATVIATSEMELIAVFKRDIWALEQRSPATRERLRQLIAERTE
jgi:CRP/FNR family transcriptional regulator, cyclic AMP receptor protein